MTSFRALWLLNRENQVGIPHCMDPFPLCCPRPWSQGCVWELTTLWGAVWRVRGPVDTCL